MNEKEIFSITRPHANLLKLYFIRALLTGPGFIVTFPVLVCRYYTLKYNFDEEGIGMSWGVLFRRQINLTYARIQDIHLSSSFIQRWFGLADIQIQTASGNAAAEMVIEGVPEFEVLRDYLYSRMRGLLSKTKTPTTDPVINSNSEEIVSLLTEIRNEIRMSRELIETGDNVSDN